MSEQELKIVLAEYETLRVEIGRYQDHQNQILNFVFLVTSGAIALSSSRIGGGEEELAALALLFLPPLYLVLAALYTDRTIRVISAATYIHTQLRPRASRLVGTSVWEWEDYKRRIAAKSRLRRLLDRARWLAFLVPSSLALLGYLIAVDPFPDNLGQGILLAIGVASWLGTLAMAWVTEETSGATQEPLLTACGLDLDRPTGWHRRLGRTA